MSDFWEKDLGITAQAVSDTVIWRAANQVIKLYPEESELAACQRADAAYEAGDMFNFELWQRVARAVKELPQARPSRPDEIN